MNEDNTNEFKQRCIAGRNPVMEALKSGVPIDKLLISKGSREGMILKLIAMAKEKGIPVVEVQRQKLEFTSGTAAHQGVIALAAEKEYCEVEDILKRAADKGEKPFIIIADGLEDPHNLGAVIRTADAAGAHGIIVPRRHSAPLSPSASKAAAGALEYMLIARVANISSTIDELKDKGIWIFGADSEGKKPYYEEDFNCPCAIVIGSEGFGISRLVLEKCDFTVSIPMLGGVSSLNASAAAAILMYEAVKQRIIKK